MKATTSNMNFSHVHSFYSFFPIPEATLSEHKTLLSASAQELQIRGLVILGTEGVNTTLCGTPENLAHFCDQMQSQLKMPEVQIKKSQADKAPFKRFHVKIRKEIVTLDRPDIVPGASKHHLSPTQWDAMMDDPNTVVVDTRNVYETKIGKFKTAIDLEIDEFTDFPEKMKSEEWDKSKNYLIYCTGGIRCEKAIYSMENLGYENVYQLDGGILNYLEQKPQGSFEGECFVFDSRVSLDKDLKPSTQYSLCPHCGDVADQAITCLKCDTEAKICEPCQLKAEQQKELETCSKNCAYHYDRDPTQKSPQQKRFYHEK